MKLKRIVALLLCAFIVCNVSATAVIGEIVIGPGDDLSNDNYYDNSGALGDNGSEIVVLNGSHVGRTGTMPSGTKIYTEMNTSSSSHTTLFAYEITILEHIIVDGVEWYRFDAGSLLGFFYSDYCYVLASSIILTPLEEIEVTLEDGTIVTVSGVPSGATLEVTLPDPDYDYSQAIDDPDFGEGLFCYDISVLDAEGNEWQPDNAPVQVTLTLPELNIAEDSLIRVAHFHGDTISYIDAAFDFESSTITFVTYGFSPFFFYLFFEYNGYEFILSGGGEIYLSELFVSLGIERTVDEVVDVTFSDPTLLEITQRGDDWLLTSLASFGSTEYLTITFDDGEVIEIRVTDPEIYNYVLDNTNVTNVPKQATSTITINNTEYTVNDAAITPGGVNMLIYVSEGMAVKFTDNQTGRDYYDGNFSYFIIDEGNGSRTEVLDLNTGSYTTTLVIIDDAAPTLLEDALQNAGDELDGDYSLRNLPVTLYNYNGLEFNNYYAQTMDTKRYLAFASASMGVDPRTEDNLPNWTNSGGANGGGGSALMGLLNPALDNGLPMPSQGLTEQTVGFFSTDNIPGRDVYENVGFQFIYNETTGYYTYNSTLNHAQFDSTTNTIKLYRQSLAAADVLMSSSHGNAGFYPFVNIETDAFDQSSGSTLSWSDWVAKLNAKFELTPGDYAGDIVSTTSTDPASTVDMHFGMYLNTKFYLPENRKTDNGDEMIFEFTGDDDLWVFIDDKLVLDIGGGHTHISGSFNLTTGEVNVGPYTQVSKANGGSYDVQSTGESLSFASDVLTKLEPDKMHTIKIFYLERHSGVSNLYMNFNIPLVPVGGAEVSKELLNQDGEQLSVTPTVDYTFQLRIDATDDNEENFVPLAATPYNVVGQNGESLGSGTTDANGYFTLKAGQRAVFTTIDYFSQICVVELQPNVDYVYTKHEVKIDDGALETYIPGNQTQPMEAKANPAFIFYNYIKTQSLKIEKQVVDGADGLLDPNQEFTFTLDFTEEIFENGDGAIHAVDQSGTTVDLTDGGTFKLGQGEYITIASVPVNMSYALSEENPDPTNNSFVDPIFELTVTVGGETVFEHQELPFGVNFLGTVQDGENVITVTNQQILGLTIIKQIPAGTNPDQSFSFEITGEDGYKLRLVIPASEFDENGCARIFISGLKPGTYTVTETAWASRYTCTGISYENVTPVTPVTEGEPSITFTLGPNGEITFANERTQEHWLIDDCYIENLYLPEGIVNDKEDETEGGNY